LSSPDQPRPVDLLIVGAGFAGLYMLHTARRLGLAAQVIDSAAGVGGTWFHNRYPGARVDIQSMEYSFSFDDELQQDWAWTERYAAQPELLRYANHVADRFALRDGILLNTRLVSAHFDDADGRWLAQADSGQSWSAQFLVMATGALSAPNLPSFPGQDQFAGQVLHTAHWPETPVDLRGLRVGVVGTGSSAIQTITTIAPQVAALTVFQRTASYAVPAHNGPLDPAMVARIKADYPAFRQRNRRMRGGFGCEMPPNRVSVFSVSDAEREAQFEARWQVGGFAFLGAFNDLLTDLKANELAADFVRRKIRQTVRDPATAELLCPTHTLGCKRMCVDTGYYETFNLPHVRLVDVAHTPIERFVPEGLQVGDQVHPLDAVVLATGFDAMTGTLLRIDIRGRGGLPLAQQWQAGPVNYLGLMVAGFPNLFNIAGPGSTAAFTNVIMAIEHHVQWVANTLTHLKQQGLRTIEATDAAQASWVQHVNRAAAPTVYLSCNSWYLGANIPGKPRMFMPLAEGFPSYQDRLAGIAEQGYIGCTLA
jgi:cyclohexanone monooxygenase